MIRPKSKRAVIIPTAMFVAMVVLLLVTGIAGEAYLNLRFTGLEAERTRLTFLAEGAVNELISGLNQNPTALSYTAAAPLTTTTDGVTLRSWSEVDPAAPHLRRIYSKAYPSNAPGQAATYTRVVRTAARATGMIYTNIPDTVTTPDSVLKKDTSAASWTLLPPAKRMRYTVAGVLETHPTAYAGTMLFTGADQRSNFYVVYPPALDGWGFTPASSGNLALNMILTKAISGQTLLNLMPIAQEVAEIFDYVRDELSQGAVVLKYDGTTNLWSALPPAPNAIDSPTGPVFEAGNFHIKGLCGPVSCNGDDLYVPVYRKGPDAIYKFHFTGVTATSGTWTLLPALLDIGGQPTSMSQVAVDGLGRVFAISRSYPGGGDDAVHELRNNRWVALPEVPGSFYDAGGQLQESPVAPTGLGVMAAGQDGALYVVSEGIISDGTVDTIFKWAGGKWVAVPNQENLSHAGTGPPSVGAKKADIGVDCDGKLVVRAAVDTFRDQIFVGTGAGYQVQGPLPKMGYDASGNPQSFPGFLNYSSQVMGGGKVTSSATSYLPTASY